MESYRVKVVEIKSHMRRNDSATAEAAGATTAVRVSVANGYVTVSGRRALQSMIPPDGPYFLLALQEGQPIFKIREQGSKGWRGMAYSGDKVGWITDVACLTMATNETSTRGELFGFTNNDKIAKIHFFHRGNCRSGGASSADAGLSARILVKETAGWYYDRSTCGSTRCHVFDDYDYDGEHCVTQLDEKDGSIIDVKPF